MELARRLVVFPIDQFYAVVGTVVMATDPYRLTITDICNERSSATHGAREHLHRPGKIYLTDVELYSLQDNTQKVCGSLGAVHLSLKDIRAIIDYHPERYQGNAFKRQEYEERRVVEGAVRFVLHEHVVSGVADQKEIYRRSEEFIGLTRVAIEDIPEASGLSLPGFLELVGCRQPDYMAVNLANVYHS